MKRNLMKALCVGLSMTMVFSMVACGKKKAGGNGVSKDYAKQNVYSYKDLDLGLGENYTVSGAGCVNDRIYFLVDEYDYDTWEQKYMLVSVNKDGTDTQKVELPKQYEESSSDEDYEDIEWIEDDEDVDDVDDSDDNGVDEETGNSIGTIQGKGGVILDNAGKMQVVKLSVDKTADDDLDDEDGEEFDDSDIPWDEEDADSDDEDSDDADSDDADSDDADSDDDSEIDWGDDEIEIDWGDDDGYSYGGSSYEYSSYTSGMISSDGLIYAVRNSSYEDYSDPDNYIYEEKAWLDCWDMNGAPKWEVPLDVLNADGAQYYVQKMVQLKDGSVALLLAQESNLSKVTIDSTGKVSPIVKIDTKDIVADGYNNVVAKANGNVLLGYYSDMNMDKMNVVEVDMEKGTIFPSVEVPTTVSNNMYGAMGGNNCDFIYCSGGEGIYTYNLGEAEPKKMMDFVNSDINVGSLNYLYELDDKSFIGIYTEAIEWKSVASIFTKVDPKDIKDKSIIVVGGNGIGYDGYLKKRVIDFNKSNDSYRMVLKDYSENDNTEDGSGALTQLNNDIISGNMPDILYVGSDFSVDSYIAKGLFADVDALIAKDEELSKVDFVDNVFEAYRVNGKLYQIVPSFIVQTYIAKSSLVGDVDGWTMQEMKDSKNKLPSGMKIFSDDITRSSFLYSAMEFCGSQFVDTESGKCHFDSQDFADILEICKDLPEEIDYENMEDDYWMNMQAQYRNNSTLLKDMYISSFRWVSEDINGYMGEDVSYLGFPNENRNGSVIAPISSYALSAKSKNLDGAWEFVRYYLTEDYQKSDEFWGLSVHKSLLEEAKKESMEKSYWTDENGEKVEYDNTMYINGQEIPYDPLSQAQADELVNFIYSVHNKAFYNDDILNIVTEEAEAYFAGQKSVKEVTDLIQNRVQLFIDESR